jgi:hypothetical protein
VRTTGGRGGVDEVVLMGDRRMEFNAL